VSGALELRGVAVRLGGQRILDPIDLDVAAGEWLCLLGPNGAGKTTLVRAVSGTVRHDGDVRLDGHRPASPRERARRIAVVPQLPVVPPGMTVFEYVLLGRTPHQGLRLTASLDDRRRSLAVLQRLDLERFTDRTLDSLSGGERQRVVLARALVADAPVLLLDEPTAALDLGHQLEILELLAELQREAGLTIVTTLHDLSIAGQFGDRVAVLHEGRLVAHGTPTEVLTPASIGQWWGVEAETAIDEDGRVSVVVRRRREAGRGPRHSAGRTTGHSTGGGTGDSAGADHVVDRAPGEVAPDATEPDQRLAGLVARGEGFEPPAA
jgi:iron complex transport system ATP-binding protein